ncbi:hypothetical protein JCM21900_000490 [Sporobolomyces salmonicolor]
MPRLQPSNPFDALPDELILAVLELATLSWPPPITHPQNSLDFESCRTRAWQLRTYGQVCRRWREVLEQHLGEVFADDRTLGDLTRIASTVRDLRIRLVCQRGAPADTLSRFGNLLALSLLEPGESDALAVQEWGDPAGSLKSLTVFSRDSDVSYRFFAGLLRSGSPLEVLRTSALGSLPPQKSSFRPLQIGLVCLQVALNLQHSDLSLLAHFIQANQATLRHLHLVSNFCLLDELAPRAFAPLHQILVPVAASLRSLTCTFDDAPFTNPTQHLLFHVLPCAPNLRYLHTGADAVTDPILSFLPSLLRLEYLSLVRTAHALPSDLDRSYWRWPGLAQQVAALQLRPERKGRRLRVEIEVEGSLRKYDVAQRSSKAAFDEAFKGVEEERKSLVEVRLHFWEGRCWAWP